jgi:hypothetical protein
MANSGVTIVVAGEDKSGSVLDAVKAHLQEVQRRAEATDNTLRDVGTHSVPAMAAASASVRVLDGNFNNLMRAEERFLSTLPGASALMQAAFPFIGVFAVATGIYRAASAATEYIQKNREMARTIEEGFGSANLAYQKSNDELAVTNDKLQSAIDKIEKHPNNGLKLALDEDRVAADSLALSLEADNQKIAELMSKNTVSFWGNLATGVRTTADAEGLFKGYQEQARQITYAGEEKVRVATAAGNLDAAQKARTETQNSLYAAQHDWLSKINSKLTEIQGQRDETNAVLARHGVKPTDKDDAAVNDLLGLRAAISGQMDRSELTAANQKLQVEKDTLEAKREQAALADAEQKKQQEWLTKVQNLGIGNSPVASQEQARQGAKLYEEMEKQQDSSMKVMEQGYFNDAEARAEADVKASKEQIATLREVQEERMRAASDDTAIATRTAEFQERMGQLSAAGRIDAIRRASTEELEIKVNALQQMAALDAMNPDNPEKVQKDLDQIKELQQRHAQEMIELDQQQALARKAAADGYLHDILDPLMNKPKSIEDAFKKMADNILKSLEKVAEKRMIDAIDGGGNAGSDASPHGGLGAAGMRKSGGFMGAVGGLLGALTGRTRAGKASNGGLATGAGTIPDAVTGSLQQGRGGSGGSGVVVNLITQGTPQTVDSSGSSGGGNQLEQQVISIVLKDASTLGPMSRAITGAGSMLGSSS